MQLREAMETSSAGTSTGRKKLKHRLAAILSALSRRGRKRRESEEEVPPPLAFPSYSSRLGADNGSGKKHGGLFEPRRFSVSATRAPPLDHYPIDCAGRRSVDSAAGPSLLPLPLIDADAASWKTERRLTETGLPYETGEWEGRKCPPSSPFVAHLPPLPPVARWRERANSSSRRMSTHSARRMAMASSSSSDDEYDEDSTNLFSSRSFSSDSSGFYSCPRKIPTRASVSGPCRAAPQSCRYSFELPRGSAVSDGGFAVVKRSDDPYEDFRKSMQEMIAEWAPAGEGDHGAERLLETYLVLNSPRHYPAILAAFGDVRETLFP